MSVFRIERTRDYTVMSNYHLKDPNLSLKSKGLLSMMLSLPDAWDYSIRGLASICREGVDAIGTAIRELERAGYIHRHQLRSANGRISDTEYVIYERPQPPETEDSPPDMGPPDTTEPDTTEPYTENPYLDESDTENPAELNINKSNTKKSSTHKSIPSHLPSTPIPQESRCDGMGYDLEEYREFVKENISFDLLLEEYPYDRERLHDLLSLITETICTARKTIRISGTDFPADVVRARLLKLEGEHIRYVLTCLNENTTKIRNIRQYLLATLYNAPATIDSYYAARVSHDLYGKAM